MTDLPGTDPDAETGDDPTQAASRRLIAGATGPERRPLRHDSDEPRWFEPHHVRAAGPARDLAAELIAAGADILVAPTWLTHRRALLPVGETRRAHDWTAAAIRLAREAVETGLERRERNAVSAAEAAERDRPSNEATAHERPAVPRHPVLVAGVLPALDTEPEPGVGRLLPRDVASERDHRAQAGLLAEAGADLVLVEGNPGVAQARVAVEAAVETGLPVWVAQPVTADIVPSLLSGESVEAWAEAMTHAGARVLLLSPAAGAAVPVALARLQAAGIRPDATGALPSLAATTDAERLVAAAQRWLEAGAWHLGIGDGTTPERIAILREALDAIDAERLARIAAERDRWTSLVEDAAHRAPGGRAAWIGRGPAVTPLPSGFHWTTVPMDAVGALPPGALRLVISRDPAATPDRLAPLLEPGGVLLASVRDPASVVAAGLRVIEADPGAGRTTILARRDP